MTCCCCCLSVWGLYPLPRVSSVPTTRDALSPAAFLRVACTPFPSVFFTDPKGRFFTVLSLLWCVGRAYPLAAVVVFRTPRSGFSDGARVSGACAPFRERRLYRPHGTLVEFHILFLLACVGAVPSSASVVCTAPAGRSISSQILAAWGLYPLLGSSSVPTPRNAFSHST